MLSGRTIATMTVAAPTMYPLEALPGDVYVRDGEKVAEVAGEVPVAARTIEEGASAPMTAVRPSVLSPDEQLRTGGLRRRLLHTAALARARIPRQFLDPGCPGDATSLRSSRVGPHGRKVADGQSHAAREQPDHAQARRARPVRPAGSERAFQRPPELLGDARTPLRRGRVGLRRRDATRTFRVRAISRWSQPRYRSHARAAGGRASETSSAARRMCRTYSCPMAA